MSTQSRSNIQLREARNAFLDPGVVADYEGWYETRGRRADRREKALLAKLLTLFPDSRTVLEVGCGTGHFTRWLASRGAQTLGLDISAAMLAEARRRSRGPLVLGDASRLPLRTGACDLAMLVTTLEFVEEPVGVVREALRVAKHGILLGLINGRSGLGRRLKRTGGAIWGVAHLYTPRETVRIVTAALAGRPASLRYRTTLWTLWPSRYERTP